MKVFLIFVAMAIGISSIGSTVPMIQENEITSDAEGKIEKGLNFLAKKQTNSGSLGGSVSVATTAMAGLAWLANGSTPERGKYSENIYKAIKYILKCTNSKNGLIQESMGGYSSMQGHGFATLFLAESIGMITESTFYTEVKEKLKLAVKYIEKSQNKYGGWGDSGGGPDSTNDGSGAVAIMQINALRSARNQGIVISEKVLDKSKKYLNEMTNDDGSYSYNYGSKGPRQSSGLTGAGMYMLGAMDMYKDNKKYDKGIKYLMKHAPFLKGSGDYAWQSWEYFTLFYSSLAIFQWGGSEWKEWYPKMRDSYCKKQSGSGEWGPDSYNGLWSAFCLLALQLPYRTLPLFQQGGRGAEGQ